MIVQPDKCNGQKLGSSAKSGDFIGYARGYIGCKTNYNQKADVQPYWKVVIQSVNRNVCTYYVDFHDAMDDNNPCTMF